MSKLRPIDKKRMTLAKELPSAMPTGDDIGFIHTVLAQCFLPYRDPKQRDWQKISGDYAIILTSGTIQNPQRPRDLMDVGLPYGAKPRLFQSYVCTQVIKQQSPVIPVEHSMTAMMKELGLQVTGGKEGTIGRFKEQIIRFAACNFTIVGPGPRGERRYIKAPPIKRFDIWFPTDPDQKTLWPSEIVLTDDYFYSLKDHAIPFDFRGMRAIQNNARAQDIYLWMTQRLCRVPFNKPLFMTWEMLIEMFGGGMSGDSLRKFPERFRTALLAAYAAYPDARMEETPEGYRFFESPPPVPRTKLLVHNPSDS